MSSWQPPRKLLEDARINYKDIALVVAWFVVDSLRPQNVYAKSMNMLYIYIYIYIF